MVKVRIDVCDIDEEPLFSWDFESYMVSVQDLIDTLLNMGFMRKVL